MGGQMRDEAPDGSYRVTIGSTNDPKYGDDTYFISQQDDDGNHTTSIFDSDDNFLGESNKGKGL